MVKKLEIDFFSLKSFKMKFPFSIFLFSRIGPNMVGLFKLILAYFTPNFEEAVKVVTKKCFVNYAKLVLIIILKSVVF